MIFRRIMKCLPPPRYHQLKKIILTNYSKYNLTDYTDKPKFIPLRSNTLKNILTYSKHRPTKEDKIKIIRNTKDTSTTEIICYIYQKNQHHPYNHPKCATCQHYITSTTFKSTTTKQHYRIRHPFTCQSKNIYLITRMKCEKQYIGKTERTLREHISQHQSSTKLNQSRYISRHFNLENHSLRHLKVLRKTL